MDDTTLTIGQLAAQAGLRTSAIRDYERVGVLPEPAREGGRRRYGEAAVRRLEDVDRARRADPGDAHVAGRGDRRATLDACGLFAPAGGPAAPLGAVAGAG